MARVAHVTRTPLSRSRSPGHFTHRGLNASGSCSGERGSVLGVRNNCYFAVCSAAPGASAPTKGGEGRGISWRPPAYSLLLLLLLFILPSVSIPEGGLKIDENKLKGYDAQSVQSGTGSFGAGTAFQCCSATRQCSRTALKRCTSTETR